jgi:hypothetical protein
MTIPPSTAGWTFANIKSKIRSITGTPSTDQLSEAQVGAYANDYLQYTMPHELKVQIDNNFLDFKTVPGQNVYSFPGAFLTDSPGAYADGFPLIFYQDPDIFYQDWPQQYNVDSVAAGTGSQFTFTGNTQGFPIIAGSYFITDSIQVLQDDGIGNLVAGNTVSVGGSGTIDYVTGAFSATFITAPAATLTVYDKYIAYQGNRPQGVLFFENQFTVMPVPDQVYQMRMQGFIFPSALVNDSDLPQQPEWGPLIAYGASLEIFSDRGDTASFERYAPMLKRYENVALSRTIQQYTAEQGVPRF